MSEQKEILHIGDLIRFSNKLKLGVITDKWNWGDTTTFMVYQIILFDDPSKTYRVNSENLNSLWFKAED